MLFRRSVLSASLCLSLVACGSNPSQEDSNSGSVTAPKAGQSKQKLVTSPKPQPRPRQNTAIVRSQKLAPSVRSNAPVHRPARIAAAKPAVKILPAQLNSLPPTVKTALKKGGISASGMSVFVKAVNSPKPLLAYKANTPRNPASVMKLLTTYAALGILGPDYRWPIEVYAVGNISGGVLNGDLVFKGYGYPQFQEADLRRLLQGVRAQGIQHIKGNLVFDNSAFKVSYQHPGRFDGQPTARYNAQPDALLFKERQGCFVVNKGTGKARIDCPESSQIVKVKNNLKMTNGACRGLPKMRVIPRGGRKITVEFYGTYSRNCGQKRLFNVGLFATTWKTWQSMGGSVQGGFLQGRTPPNARLVHTHYSKPLRDIIPTVNKKSNNVMARQLLLSIGHKQNGVGTINGGVKAMRAWFASRGLHFPELRVENGSGLSRQSRVSAISIGKLLDDAYRSPYRNDFMRSLAVLGVDGTLKRRMKNTAVRGRGQFKTGTLRNVRGIAGYVKARDGQTYIVSVLHNDPKARSRALSAHDEVIKWAFGGGKSRYVSR